MRRIGDWPLLPVFHRADGNKLVGVVALADILETYANAGRRRSNCRNRRTRTRSLYDGVPPSPRTAARLPTVPLRESWGEGLGIVQRAIEAFPAAPRRSHRCRNLQRGRK